VDLCGEGDAHGREGLGRTDDRWRFERQIFEALVTGFETSGDLKVNCPAEKR